ncbi:DNA-binding ferritin-like protein (Dps family) [Clostridiales Family XIII bacterium PM5-7]
MSKESRRLAKENSSMEKQIFKENDEDYTNIIVYLRGAGLSDYSQEEVRRDILNMVLEGQSRGQTMGEIIGEDYKRFCDNVINEFPPESSVEKFLDNISLLLSCTVVLGAISIIKTFFQNVMREENIFAYSLSLADVLNFIIIVGIAYGVVMITIKNSLSVKKVDIKSPVLRIALIWVGLFLCGAIFIGINTKLNVYELNLHLLVAVAVVICAAAGYGFIDHRKQ